MTVAIQSKYGGKTVFATRLLSIQIHFIAQCYIQATDNTAPQLFHCMLTIVMELSIKQEIKKEVK